MRNWLVRKLLEDWVPFKWINGHKTDIARVATFVFGALLLVKEVWPEYAPFITEFQALLGTVFGLLGVEFGKAHKEAKKG